MFFLELAKTKIPQNTKAKYHKTGDNSLKISSKI